MHKIGTKITDVKIYVCGYCVNNLHRAIKGARNETRQFPATAVFFRHDDDCWLFDTGYATRIFKSGWQSRIYHWLNPVVCDAENELVRQLAKRNIPSCDVKGIILSHLHPDHIGGLLDFPQSRIIISEGVLSTLQKRTLSDLVFKSLLPNDMDRRCEVFSCVEDVDLFGDGSLMIKDIPGHAKGQIGILLTEHNLFFAADSCWNSEWINNSLTPLGRFLQNDYTAYLETLQKIQKMREDDLTVVFSHEEVQ